MKRLRELSIDPSFYLAASMLTRFIEEKDHIREEEICDIVLMSFSLYLIVSQLVSPL